MTSLNLTRRQLFGITTTSAASVLVGCANSAQETPEPTPSGGSSDVLPDYHPITLVKPDLSSPDPEIPDAFFAYPAERPSMNKRSNILGGATISTAARASGPVPPPPSQNSYWQELNKRLNGSFEMIITPPAEYQAKFQTLVAGDTIPEIIQVSPNTGRLPSLLRSRFADLSDYLGGSAITAYPNLAAIPTYAWRSCVYEGRLRGVPFAQPLISNGLALRADISKSLGVPYEFSDGDDFMSWCREVTSPREQRWALMKPDRMLMYVFAPMMGCPNEWRVVDGKFSSEYETDEFAAAIDAAANAFKEGLFHPDSLANPKPEWFANGTVVSNQDGLTAWNSMKQTANNDELELSIARLPRWDGEGLAPVKQLAGIFTFASVRQGSEEDVLRALATIDWLAAPFGSEEQFFLGNGIEGVHYEMEGTAPVDLPASEETRVPLSYIGRGAPRIFAPGYPEFVQDQFDYQVTVKPESLPHPTIGLRSETFLESGASIRTFLMDGAVGIISGRRKMSEWSSIVKEWKDGGGDIIAQEFTESLAMQS